MNDLNSWCLNNVRYKFTSALFTGAAFEVVGGTIMGVMQAASEGAIAMSKYKSKNKISFIKSLFGHGAVGLAADVKGCKLV